MCDAEKQLEVADSFKLEFPSYPTSKLNELSAEESSGDKVELIEMSRGKRWGNNNKHNQKHSSFSKQLQLQQQTPTKQTSGQSTRQTVGKKSKDSKITLTQESAHYVPTELSSSFFRQFDLVMKLK